MACAAGQQQVCDNQFQPGFTHWGSFAEYVAIDRADVNLVALPESISDVAAAAEDTNRSTDATRSAAAEMSRVADELRELVGQYR